MQGLLSGEGWNVAMGRDAAGFNSTIKNADDMVCTPLRYLRRSNNAPSSRPTAPSFLLSNNETDTKGIRH